jgi:peroxiredoxin
MRFLFILAVVLLATQAHAYTPAVGNRAAEISGRDAISDKVVRLSDYHGKWVFVDFWASWCGPCMGELPNLLKVTNPLRKQRSDFAVFTVSLDDNDTSGDLNKVIREHKLTYPVVYDGNGWNSVQGKEWGINSIPATFLIDPAGNIVATGLRGEHLGPALDFFLNYKGDYAPVGVATNGRVNADNSVTLHVSLSNPRHTPLKVKLDYGHLKVKYADDDPEHKNAPVSREFVEKDEKNAEEELEVSFGEFSETVHTFTIPGVEGASRVYYDVMVLLPETEALAKGEGIWVTNSGNQKIELPAAKPTESPAPVEELAAEDDDVAAPAAAAAHDEPEAVGNG